MSSSKSRISIFAVSFIAMSLACSQNKPAPFEPEDHSVRDDRDAPFNPPERYPEWAFDQPEYVKPAAPDQPETPARGTDPHHFFTNKRIVMVEQPSGYTPEETPRIAVYYTNDNGFHWHKAGYFGREQSYFPLETDEDGDYGVNFVGPGQKPEEHTPAYPARMYHVDTMLPEVLVNIDPEKTWYDIGDEIRISWEAKDPHLEQFPVRIGMLMDFTASEHDLIELQRDLPDDGSIDYRISSETEGHEIVFRVEALDRAGNLGLAYSHALQIKDRADDQIVSKPRRHHDDTIRSTRRSTARPTITQRKPALVSTSNADSTTASTMAESGAAPRSSKPKTRVKVVTIGNTEKVDSSTANDSMTTMSPSPTNNSTEMNGSDASMTGDDSDIVGLLDCDDRKSYQQTISGVDNDAEPVASTSPAKVADLNATPATTMTIQEALEPLKEAIGKLADYKRPAMPANSPPTVAAVVTDTAPTKSVVSSPMQNSKPVVARPVEKPATTKVATRNTARPVATTTRPPTDPTRGSSLVVPMPGTIANSDSNNGTSHPWRTLGAGNAASNGQTWTLPEAKATVSAKPIETAKPAGGPILVTVPEKDELPAD